MKEKELLEFLNNNLCFNFYRLSKPLVRIHDFLLKTEHGVNISFPQLYGLILIYYYISYKGVAPSIFDILEVSGSERTTIIRDFKVFEKKNLILNNYDGIKSKRRRHYRSYELSEDGIKVVEECLPFLNKINRQLFMNFSKSDKGLEVVGRSNFMDRITNFYHLIYDELTRIKNIDRKGENDDIEK